MSDNDSLLPGILARQERQKEFLQGLKDAKRHGFAESVATAAVVFAGLSAYERYRRAKQVGG